MNEILSTVNLKELIEDSFVKRLSGILGQEIDLPIEGKISRGQTNKIVLNIADWGGEVADIITEINKWPIDGLEEIKVVNQYGQVINIYP